MALIDLTDIISIESAPWNLVYQQEFSGLGSGEGLAHDLGPPLWESEVASGPHVPRRRVCRSGAA